MAKKDKELVVKDSISILVKKLEKELESRYTDKDLVVRGGTQIVIPEHMNFKDAANTLLNREKQMEEISGRVIVLTGHPDDALVAFYRATTRVFGIITGKSSFGFFGMIPALTTTVQISHDETLTVPIGKIEAPGWPLAMNISINNHGDNPMLSTFHLQIEYKRKFQPIVDQIEAEIKKEFKENSIFKGKAIDSKFNFIDLNGFPLDRIIYTEQEHKELSAHIFRLIRSRSKIKRKGLPVKRTILLHGKFGTGKTLTALLGANICIENGWTFMNVLPGDNITVALEFARKFQPAVVFCEDIDSAVPSQNVRSGNINAVLNTIDGVLNKSAQVMVILTTNHVNRIESAMMRPGRIDAVIKMGRIDEGSIVRLLKAYTGDLLEGELDARDLMEVSRDYTPSFIAEAANRAVLYALERNEGNGSAALRVTHEDLKAALVGLREQYELMTGDREKIESSFEEQLKKLLDRTIVTDLHRFGGRFSKNVYDYQKAHIEDEKYLN